MGFFGLTQGAAALHPPSRTPTVPGDQNDLITVHHSGKQLGSTMLKSPQKYVSVSLHISDQSAHVPTSQTSNTRIGQMI